jgi:DNA (cytosine-5)-methyltransferase 1
MFTRPRAADLFCGAGGLGFGLDRAGFDVVVGVDHNADALQTCAGLLPGLTLNWDLSDPVIVADLADLLNECDLDLIAGGPPCQPFSRAGISKIRDLVSAGLRSAHDDRRDLWESYLEVVLTVRPPAVLLENVPDMAFRDEMAIFRSMVQLLEEEGYEVHARIVNASAHGVPQFRQRLVVVALAHGAEFRWPRPGRQVSVRDAIGDLPPVEGGARPDGGATGWWPYKPGSASRGRFVRAMRADVPPAHRRRIYDHITRPVRDDDRLIFEQMRPDTLYSDIDPALRRYRADIFDDKYKRLDPDQPSRSITAHIGKDGYWYIHPFAHRTLTVREAARLQTFPDHVRFAGPPSSAFRQIGNAVPPRLAEAVGRSVLDSLTATRALGVRRSTIAIANELAGYFWRKDELAVPWLAAGSAWAALQGEIVLGRAGGDLIARAWPHLEKLDHPELTLERADSLQRTVSATGLRRILRAAEWYVSQAGDHFSSAAEMARNPHVPAAAARLADVVALGQEPDPVLVNHGLLRVAARYWGLPIDARNRMTDGRIALARLIGDGTTSRPAQAGLIEIGRSHCHRGVPVCTGCPLAPGCATFGSRKH